MPHIHIMVSLCHGARKPIFPFNKHVSFLDQYLILGAEEGIYTLNLNELHEDTLEKVKKGMIHIFPIILLKHNTLLDEL